MRHLNEAWERYHREVIPATAGAVQIIESKRAFFAGAQSLFHLVVSGLSSDAEPTEPDLQLITDIHTELRDWLIGVASGDN